MANEQPPINDPFGALDGQRTFIKPNPGGWSAGRTQVQAPATGPAGPAMPDVPSVAHGLNPLLAEANALLMLVPRLRHTRQVADPAALRASLAQGVRDFAKAAQDRGIAPERVMAARYVLCTRPRRTRLGAAAACGAGTASWWSSTTRCSVARKSSS
jgi:type VI secretion system protein ImpK